MMAVVCQEWCVVMPNMMGNDEECSSDLDADSDLMMIMP